MVRGRKLDESGDGHEYRVSIPSIRALEAS